MGYERNDRRDDRDRYGYDDDRGFFQRAGDEVRSWFGDEEAERRRRFDERYDERFDRGGYGRSGYGGGDGRGERFARYEPGGYRAPEGYPRWYRSNRDEDHRRGAYAGGYAGYDQDVEARRRFEGARGGGYGPSDDGRREHRSGDHDDYSGWRERQISSFDRDYDEYRRENRSRFESEFATWRQNRQTQRDALRSVQEHQEVVGSDGGHVGKVDHVRGDHILLAKTDRDAGGHHHRIPSSWIATVDDKVHLTRTAAQAQSEWRDAEQRGGLFGNDGGGDDRDFDSPGGKLNRSFSGTY